MGFLNMDGTDKQPATQDISRPVGLKKGNALWIGGIALGIIVLLAVGVRGVLVNAGLPLLLYEDEPIYYRYALDFGLGNWHADYFNKPGFFLYFYGFFYFLKYQLGHWLNASPAFLSWANYLAAFGRDPGLVAITGRWVSVLLAGGTVALLGRLGWRLFGAGIGLAAAAWLAGALVHVRISPIVIADIPALFFILLAALLAIRVYEQGRWRDYLLCATVITLAISFKYNVFTVFFLLAAHSLAAWSPSSILSISPNALNEETPVGAVSGAAERLPNTSLDTAFSAKRIRRPWLAFPRFWIALLGIPLLFVLLNPMTLLHFADFRKDIALEKKHMLLRHVNVITSIPSPTTPQKPTRILNQPTHFSKQPVPKRRAKSWQWMASFPAIFFRIFPKTLGWPLYALGLIAIPYFLRKGPHQRRAVLAFPLVFLLAVLQFQLINAKYLLPVIVFWVLFAFAFLHSIVQAVADKSGIQAGVKTGSQAQSTSHSKPQPVPLVSIVFGLLAVALLSSPWLETLAYVKIYTRPDTRQQAAQALYTLAHPNEAVLLEPDTLTLNPRVIRSGWHFQVIEPPSSQVRAFEMTLKPPPVPHTAPLLQVKGSASAGTLEIAKKVGRLPRFVLLNLGNANKKTTASGNNYYEMPYAPSYYGTLQANYSLKTVFAPYAIHLEQARLQHTWRAAGFPALYALIQEAKSGRKNPGPLLILMERRTPPAS